MDKDLLRIVLIGLGISLVVGIYLWSRVKNKRFDYRMEDSTAPSNSQQIKTQVSPRADEPSNGDFDIEPFGLAVNEPDDDLREETLSIRSRARPAGATVDTVAGVRESKKLSIKTAATPALIQFAIVATEQQGFTGSDLVEAFEDLELVYDALKIFHRLQPGTRKIDFSVANLVEPGTFPEDDIRSFRSPGITLFLQPPELTNPAISFERMLSTGRELARRLNGKIWDANRQPLTEHTVHTIRRSLR